MIWDGHRRAAGAVQNRRALRERVMELALSSPKDTLAVLVATAAIAVILVNVLFLQKGRHLVADVRGGAQSRLDACHRACAASRVRSRTSPRRSRRHSIPSPPASRTCRSPCRARSPAVPNAKPDPLADLIVANRRILARRGRRLSKSASARSSRTALPAPRRAIAVERFERKQRLPVTGQLSDRVLQRSPDCDRPHDRVVLRVVLRASA